MKKVLALLSAAALVLALASCGSSKDEVTTTEKAETTVSQTVEAETEGVSESATEESVTESATEAESNKEGLDSTDVQEVVDLYVSAAKAMPSNMVVVRSKTLTKLDGGTGGAGGIISKLEGIAKNVLAGNSGEDTGMRGYPELITADDISSATAKVNGNNTEITMKIKDYTAMPMGKANEGSVGHVIGVLDTINEALDELPLTVNDPSNIRLQYTNASVTAKVDNTTGKLVSAKWVYDVKIKINNTKAKMGISFTLDGAEVAIHYEAAYK